MQMNMIHSLPAIRASVDNNAIAFAESLGARDLCRHRSKVTEQRLVCFIHIGERGDMLPRHNQYVNRSLRVNVRERVAMLVLIDGCRGNASVNDLAKQAAHNGTSVQE